MQYCQKLLQALNQWKQALDELKNAKDEYLRYFTEEKKKEYEQKRNEVLKAKENYFQVKEKSYVNVKITKNKEEKIFAPEYEALERLYQGCGWDEYYLLLNISLGRIKVENGRVVELHFSDLASPHDTPEIIQKRTEAFKNIRYLPKLKKLYCFNNNLLELDVSQNKELEELYCSHNRLRYLDLRENKKLKKLYCFNNQLQSLDVSQNKELEELDCSRNQFQQLDVSENKKLKVLDCSYNFLPLEVCQQIETQTNIKTLHLYPQYPIEILNFLNDLKQQNLTLEEAKMQFAKEIQKFKEDIYKNPQKLELYGQWKLILPNENEQGHLINLIF